MHRIVRKSLFITYIGVISLSSAIGIPARGDVVTDWNNAALDAIRTGRTAPPIASRSLAILHTAMYDAVNGIARTHEPYLVPSGGPASLSREAAASAAAHETLVHLFPASASNFDPLHAVVLATPPAFLPCLLPQWGFVSPYAMSSSSQFRPPGPPALDRQQHAADYEEVND